MTNRRTYLQLLGAGGGFAFIAGCVDETASGGDDGTTDSDQPDDPESAREEDGSSEGVTTYAPPREVHETLESNGTSNYEGEMVDVTGEDAISVAVGAGNSGLAFDPPAVRVDPGTQVVWEWTGNGGAHNVVATDPEGAFDSGETRQGSDISYAVAFEADGNYIYNCRPHAAIGMYGAVVVGNGGRGDPDAVAELDAPGGEDGSDSGNETEPPEPGQPVERAEWYLEANDASLYQGGIADGTGLNRIEIGVGVGDGFGFQPTAVRVDPGTEVIWVWTGQGGAHNVVAAEESVSEFQSGDPVAEEGHNWRRTFEAPGAHLYYCAPHQAVGMAGAIIVEE